MQKNIRHQIVDRLLDKDTVEHLLRQQELSLEAASSPYAVHRRLLRDNVGQVNPESVLVI